MKTEKEAIKIAKTPEPVIDPKTGEKMYAPMDKLAIALYGSTASDLEDEEKINNVFRIINQMY